MTRTLAQPSDVGSTARRLGASPDDIQAICSEYELAEAAAGATFGCGSVARVKEAGDRYMRAGIAIEALALSLPAAHRQMAALDAAEMAEAENLERGDLDALLRLALQRSQVHRAIVEVSAAARPHGPGDPLPGQDLGRSRRPRQRRSHRRQAKSSGSDDDGDGEPPREPAALADIERLIRRLVPDLVRRELEAHAGRLAAALTPEPPIADDVAELVAHDLERARRARRPAGGRP